MNRAKGSVRTGAAVAALAWTLGTCPVAGAEAAAPVPPPPAGATIDFNRDVKPILEFSCLRCHGPEKPKSRFRLDNRESALKGGSVNFDDIVPGDSAQSRLIHYVSGVVEEMRMPPPGKGDPLTPEQIGILRAWIDQGAAWDSESANPRSAYAVTPTLRWIGVSGDTAKFRELEGVEPGWGGGLENFSLLKQDGPGQKFLIEGHGLPLENDYQLKLNWSDAEAGFVRAGFEQWRRYYDDTGGFYEPFVPQSFDLGRDLYLDIGRVWIDFGLTLPDWPEIVFGYEYQFRDGNKSMLEWGSVIQSAGVKNIYPASKSVNERTRILKLDINHTLYGWRVENNARIEFYDNTTRDEQIRSYTTGPAPDSFIRTQDKISHVRGVDTFRLEKQFTRWWFASGGYMYSRLEGDSSMNQSTEDAANTPVFGNYWNNQVTLERETHAFNLASLFVPRDGLSLSVGVQSEFTHQEGSGNINLDFGDPTVPGLFFLQPGTIQSDLDQTRLSEHALLRFTKVPFTVLFAEGRFSQDSIGQFEQEAGSTADVFLRDTDYQNFLQDLRGGFSTSPWRWFTLNAHYRRRESDSDYDNRRDDSPAGGLGYSAFIRHREIVTDEVETKLAFRPATWLKTALTYQWTRSDFLTATDPVTDPFFGNVSPGGQNLAGNCLANIYGLHATFIPSQRLFLSGAFTYTDSSTVSAGNAAPYVVPYQGDIYSVIAAANYSLNRKTSVLGSFSFSRADWGQTNPGGLPLGLDYTRYGLSAAVTRQLTKALTATVRYSFYRYDETSSGGLEDFTGNGIFASLSVKWQ